MSFSARNPVLSKSHSSPFVAASLAALVVPAAVVAPFNVAEASGVTDLGVDKLQGLDLPSPPEGDPQEQPLDGLRNDFEQLRDQVEERRRGRPSPDISQAPALRSPI